MPVSTHLVVVCCHGIYFGPDSSDESNWLIEPFQTGETGTYIAHIEAGVRALAKDDRALLVFSGGATKRSRTEMTEGQGYLNVALERNLFGLETSPPSLRRRMFVDRFATDSYQNILCSLIQSPLFSRKLLQDADAALEDQIMFPTKLTIVSHEFKRSRFLDLHLPAMHWTGETNFIGINPPFDAVKMAEIETGDRLRGYGAWERDLYGAGELLANKRIGRGWIEEEFHRKVLKSYPFNLRKELEGLLYWNGGEDLNTLWAGNVPWE